MQGRGNSYRSRKKLAAPPCLEEGQLRQDSSMEYATREMCSTPSLSQSGTLSSARSANDDRDTLPAPDSVGVAVRVRPMTTVESADPRIRNCIQCLKDIVVIGGTSSGVSSSSGGTGAGAASGSSAKAAPTIRPQQFRADTVFHAHSSQNDVYTASCRCIVEGLFLGINGSILAYGATGSGKTHTMFGGTTGAAGIVYRAVQDIFDEKARLEEEEGRLVQVKCSFVEIYNEEVFDLLAEYAGASTNNNNISSSGGGGGDGTAKAASSSASPTGPSGSFASTAAAGAGASSTGVPPRSTPKDGGGGGSSSTKQQQQQHTQRVGRTPLQVRHLKAKGHDRLEICGLRHVFPTTVDDFVSAVQLGHTKRFTAATGANAQSSRSHAIITVEVEVSGGDGEHGGGGGVRGTIASIRFCDLAGSERAASTSNSGIRLREGGKINRSLLALGAVVQALVQRKRHPEKSVFVPYRGSKLTRLLADGIGGNCRTQMLFCLSPSTRQYEESLNTMLFAMQAKEIQVAARRNTFNSEQVAKSQVVLIDELRTELAQVKEELAWARAELQDPNRTARRYSTINGEHSLSRCQSVSPGMPAMNLSLGRIDTGTTLDLQLSGTRDHMRSGCGSPDLINAAHFASAEDANNPATPSPTNFRDGSPQCSPGGAAGVGETHASHGGFTGGSVSIGLDGLHGVESHMLEPSRSMGRQPSFRQTARQSVFTEGSPMFTELALKLKGFTSDKEVLYHQLRDAQEEQREVDIQLREHKWRLAQFLASNAIGGKVRGEPVCGTTTSGGIAVTPVGVAGLRKLITQLEADTKMKDGELQDLTDRHDALDRQIAATREALLSEKQQPSLELLLDNAQLKQNCTEAECLAATYHQECRAARSREGEYAQALAACVGAIHGLLPLVPHTTTAMDDAKLALIYANLPKASTSEMIHVFENALRADATPPLPPPSIAGSPMRRHARHNSGDLLDTSASDLEEHFKELMEVASSVQLHHHRRRSSGHNIGQEEGMTSPTSASGPVLAPHSPRPPLPAANAVPLCTPSPSPELPQAEALTAEKPRRADDGDEVREASGGGGGSSSDATIREHASSSGEPSRASSSSVETQSSLDAPAALVVDANSILDATPLQLFPETLLGVGVELEDLDGGTSPSECTPGTDMQTATPAALPNSANTTPLEDDEKEQPHSATTANVPALADASILGPFPRTTCSPDTDELANREVELPTTLSPPPPPPTPVVVVEASASVPSSAGEGPLSPPLRQSTQPPESRTSVSSELTPMALRPKSYTRSFSTSNLQATPKKKKKKRGEDEGVAAMGRSPLPQRPASASPLPQPRRAGSGLGPSRMGNGTASPFQRQKTATPNRAPTATRTSAARGATAGSPVPRRRPGTSADATAPAPPPPPNLHERRSNLARATAEAFQRLHSDAASSMAQASHVSNSSGLGAPSWDMFTRSRTAPLPNLSNASTPSTSGNGSGNPSSCGISTHPTGVFDEDRSFFSDASDPRSQKEQRSDDSSLASPRRRAGRRVGGATSTRTGAAPSSSSFSSNAAAERRASTPLRSSASPTKPSKAYNVNKWLRNGAAAKVVVPAPTPTAPSRRGMSSNITITTTNTNTNNNGSNAAPAPKTKDQRGGVAAPNRRTRRGASPPPVPPHTSASPPPNTNTATTNKNNAPAPASTMTLDPPNVEMKSSMLVPPVPSFPPTGPLRQKQTNASASKNSGAYMSSTSSRGSRSSAAGTPMSGVGGGLADDCSPLTNPNGSGSLWGTRTDRAFSMISALSNVSAYSFGDENDDLQVSRSTVSEMVSPRP